MKTRRHLPRAGLILPLFMGILLLAARPAAAQFSEAVLAGSGVTNYTGYVIDADQASVTNNAAFNREFIIFQAVVRTTNTTASLLQRTNVYSLRLLGTNGLPVPIYDLSGTTTNAGYSYNITNTISVPALGTNILARVANLRPVSRLNPFDRYTVDFRVLTNGVATAAFTNDGPRPYYHFTNTVSGDASYNVLTEITNVSTNLVYAVDTIPGKQAFRFDVGILLRRYDDFASPTNATDTIPFSVGYRLETAAGVVVPLVNTSTNLVAIMSDYTAGTTNPPLPRVLAGTLVVHVVPAAQLDCVANNHRLVAWVSHTDRTNAPAIVIAGNTNQSAPERLLHFNGRLVFGSGTGAIITTFNSINNSPANLGVVSGSHVTTTLGVDANSGSLPGRPFHSYGAGAALSVRLRSTGNAELAAGSVVVNQPVPDADVVNGVRFVRTGPMVLNTTGGSSPLRVLLPAGFGYRTNNTNATLTFGSIDFAALPLDANLAPGISPVYTSGGNPIFAAEESKPLWFECSSIQWDVPASRFLLNLTGARVHYVRWDEYDYLKNATSLLVDPAQAVKRSNERVFQPVNGASNVEIDVDPNGAALLKAQLLLGAGTYPTHFPYDSEVTWFAGGGLTVSSDLISSGGLTNVNPITVSYSRDCPGCAAQLPNALVQFAPSNGVLRFTRDGGLVAPGTLTATNALTWGYFSNSSSAQGFAQQAFLFSNASYHMPGSSLRGDQTGLPSGHTPAALLYTGVAATNLATVERPDFGLTPAALAYRNGFADYAGLNFAVGTNGARQGASLLAGKPTGTYQLTGRSKYYVRLGGVSGIHEAVPGTFPAGLTLYGYPFTFSNYGLNYLDSQNRDSRTDGSVSVPHPSQFTQNFKELKLTCVGGLTTAEVPSNDPDKVLNYWTADFATLSIDFQRNPGETCNPGAGYLVLGTRLTPYQLGLTNLYGSLGFLSSGDLIPQSFGLAGVDSRLKLPNVVRVAGPNTESYNLTAVSDAYLNTYGTGVNTPGWLNVAGGLDVSFFEDIKVHLQTSPDREGTNAIVHLAGGWSKAGSSTANQGWTNSAGGSFFTVTYFDPDNAGLPTGVTLSNYRDSSTTLYHPRAQKTWLQVVEFDYPLDWNTLTRSFQSHSTTSNDFLVVKVQHEVKYLSAGKAELVFGVQYDGLPQVNLTELAFNAVDEATGVAKAVANAAGDEILGAVTNGIDRITQMLDANMQQFFGQVFDQVVNPVIDTTYSALSNSFQVFATNNPCLYLPVASSNIDYYIGGVYGAGVNLSNQISTNLLGAIGQVSNVVGRIDKFLADVQLGIDAVIGNITNDINGNVISNKVGLFASTNAAGSPAIVSNLIFQLTSELAAEFISSVVNPALDSFIQEHQPTIDQVIQVLTEVRAQVAAVRAQLAAGQEFQLELVARVNGLSGDILQLCNQTRLDVSNYFASIDCTIDDPFQDITAAEIKLLIRQKFEENFFASRIPQQVGELLKQKVYDLDGQMREGIDTLFASLNDVIKDLISETLQSLDTQINGLIGDINSTVGSAQLNGYAHIAGDSLKELRIDGHFELSCPDPMEINAYLIVKELNSDGTETCSTGGGPATEVTLGAQNVDLDWISPDLRANVEVKFSFATTPSFKPIGMAGSFEVLGGLKFETFEITELAAAIAFGANENYLSAATRIRFNQYMMAGGIYFGRTCTLDPINLWAPDVAAVIGTPPFTGAYVYGEGWFPLNEALGIPSSCLFNISAGVGAGAGYFVEGPTYIGSLFAGLSGEVLCLVSVTGEAKLIGVKQGSDFRFSGTAKVSGEAGSCPFCIKFKKSFGIRYENDSWSLD